MIPTDEVQPVTCSRIELREVPLAKLAALSESVDEILRRIVPEMSAMPPELPHFNSSI